MRYSHFLIAAAAIVALPAPDPLPDQAAISSSVSALLPVIDRSCKPTGPIDVQIGPLARRVDGSFDVDFSINTRLPMQRLEWELSMPYEVSVLDGERRGSAALERGAVTKERVRLRAPGGRERREIELITRGVFLGSDETGARFEEPVTVVRRLTFGESVPVGREVVSRDPISGEAETFAEIPSVQRPSVQREKR